DKKTETSLLRGSIEVTIKNRPNDKIILSPSEKLVVENSVVTAKETAQSQTGAGVPEVAINTLMAVNTLKYAEADSSVLETQWKDNKLVFHDETFEEVAIMMKRWYDVDIEISDSRLRQKRLTGSFERETIDQALEALRISLPFRYEKKDDKIIIHR
ncbi:MAG TPA: DUF4974 domain-containing protein, partial [Chitinophagaceae bacterium]